jgi:hypothetical protein
MAAPKRINRYACPFIIGMLQELVSIVTQLHVSAESSSCAYAPTTIRFNLILSIERVHTSVIQAIFSVRIFFHYYASAKCAIVPKSPAKQEH